VGEEQWHLQQQGIILEDGSYELRLPYSDPRELVMDILKHGPEVEVIEPVSLRQLLVGALQHALQQYEK